MFPGAASSPANIKTPYTTLEPAASVACSRFERVKKFFDTLSNTPNFAGLAFERTAPCCAQNLCAFGA